MALESQQKRTFQKIWMLNKKSTKVKIPESIRGEKGMEENLPFTHDSVKIENENKEILEHQFVTTS
jgi:hypothetical protein